MLALVASPALAQTPSCGAPVNEIVAEKCLLGSASSEWDAQGAGDPSIQGFAKRSARRELARRVAGVVAHARTSDAVGNRATTKTRICLLAPRRR